MSKPPQERLEKKVRNTCAGNYPPEVKDEALAMHLHMCTPKEIAKKMGLEEYTVKQWVKTRRFTEARKQVIKSVYGDLYTRRKDSFENIVGMGAKFVERFIANELATNEAPTLQEAQGIMGLIAQSSKFISLEEGKPTEITKRITVKEAKQKIIELVDSDPFGEFGDEGEFEVIDEEGSPVGH